MKKNTNVMRFAGAATLIVIAIIIGVIIAISPFFNIANVVSGGH